MYHAKATATNPTTLISGNEVCGIATKVDNVEAQQAFDVTDGPLNGEDGPLNGEDGGVASRVISNELTGRNVTEPVTSADPNPTAGLTVTGKLPVTSVVATSGPDLTQSFTLGYTDQDPKGSSGDLLQSFTQDYTDQNTKSRNLTTSPTPYNTNTSLPTQPEGERMCSSSSVSVYEPPTRSGIQLESVYPTESRIAQKEREKARVAAGLEKRATKKYKHVEEHYDDCGNDVTVLEQALVVKSLCPINKSADTYGMLNGITSFMMLDSLNEQLPRSVIEMCCMDEFLTYISRLGNGPKIAEIRRDDCLCRLSLRSQLGINGVSDIIVPFEENDCNETRRILQYFTTNDVDVVILACSQRSPYPTPTNASWGITCMPQQNSFLNDVACIQAEKNET